MARHQSHTGIRAVVFDSYDTLFDTAPVMAVCEEIFPVAGREVAALWRRKQLEYTWLLSLMGRYEDFWQVTERALLFAVKALDLSLATDDKATLMDSPLDLEHFAEARQALNDLSPYRLGILSNGTPRMLETLVDKNGMTGLFDAVVSVHEVRAYKPDPRTYRQVERNIGTDPDAILFVSAHSFDVTGAKSCGMHGCWVNRKGGQWDSLGLLPDMVVGDLRELVEILNA